MALSLKKIGGELLKPGGMGRIPAMITTEIGANIGRKIRGDNQTSNITPVKPVQSKQIQTYNSRYPGFDEEDYNRLLQIVDSTGKTGSEKAQLMDEAYQYYYPQVLNKHKLDERQETINNWVYENGEKLANGDKLTNAQYRLLNLTQMAKEKFDLAYNVEDSQIIHNIVEKTPNGQELLTKFLDSGDTEILYATGIYDKGQEAQDFRSQKDIANEVLGGNFWKNAWNNMYANSFAPLDAAEKFLYKGYNNIENMVTRVDDFLADNLPKSYVEKKLGDRTLEEFHQQQADKRATNIREIDDYINLVNDANQRNRTSTVNPIVDNYYNRRNFTDLLAEGDYDGFFYKGLGDAASNRDMPVIITTSITNPFMGTALMATNSYVRESEEAYETMRKAGATHEQAEIGGGVVGLVNSAIEVYLDKVLGGVETSSSRSIRDAIKKNVMKEVTNKPFEEIVSSATKKYVGSSLEEGLEEWLQNIVTNAAEMTVKENPEWKDLFEGGRAAAEGGIFNPFNILAPGGDIAQNTDVNSIRQGVSEGVNNIRETTRGITDKVGITKDGTTNTQGAVAVEGAEMVTEKTEKPGVIDRITDWGAEKITNTVSAQDKLYKAQEPRMNTLTRKKDLEKRRENSDRANELIIQNGFIPTDTTSRLQAHDATMKNIWKQVEEKINGGKEIMVDLSQISDKLDEYIEKQKRTKSTLTKADLEKLKREADALRGQQVTLPDAEALKQLYNATINNRGDEKVSDVLANGLKEATHEIGVIEDNLLSEIPGEFQGLKNDFGALKDTYEDVFKADMKNQRRKGSGLTETYSRIEGLGDIANGVLGVMTGKGDLASIGKGAAKFLVGKSLAKSSDVDFLIEQGFKGLAQGMGKNQKVGLDRSQASSKTAKYNDKQMESLVNQLKKTGLAKDVILVDSVEDFNKQIGDNSARYELAGPEFFKEQLPSRVNEIERHLKEEYGTTDEPSHAAFIDNQGEWINGNMSGYGNYRDTDHREIAQTAFEDTDTRFNTATDALTALMAQTRLVRVNYNDGYMNIDTAYRPNWDQKESLNKFDDGSIKEINVDISDPETGRPIDSGVFESMNDAINFIERHFGYGISYLKDSNGDIAGATLPDGTVYLIKDNLRGDTPAHEFSHLLRSYAKKNSPSLFNALNKIAEDAPQELKDYVKRTYGDLSEDAFLDEVFAWRQGQYSGIKSAETWYQRMWSTIVQIWNDIKNSFGSKYANLDVFEAYEQMGSEELMQKVDALLKGGKEIGQGYGGTQFEIAGDIYSKNFKNWFGDWENGEGSKVVDANGNPLVVYHGGQNYHTQFKKDYIGSNFGQDSQGFFFTDSKQSAEDYANNTSYGLPRENPGVVMDVYLSLKNPLIERTDYDPINLWDNNYERLLKKANANKNDGIIIKADEGESLYVAFEPNQIKSATDNVGTYDPNNPDIRYERTEGNLNDLKKEYHYVISPNYEISSWGDVNVHGALDYMLKKKGIENSSNAILVKFKKLNSKLPKIKNGDDIANLSPIDQFGYDLKDKIIETYIMRKNQTAPFIIKDLDNWEPGDGAYPNKTSVNMKIGDYTADPHMSEFLYLKLKDEGYIR